MLSYQVTVLSTHTQRLLGNMQVQDHLGDVMVSANITPTHSIIHSRKGKHSAF